jgi:hypothetical protein
MGRSIVENGVPKQRLPSAFDIPSLGNRMPWWCLGPCGVLRGDGEGGTTNNNKTGKEETYQSRTKSQTVDKKSRRRKATNPKITPLCRNTPR